jgi:hypothetical protein
MKRNASVIRIEFEYQRFFAIEIMQNRLRR